MQFQRYSKQFSNPLPGTGAGHGTTRGAPEHSSTSEHYATSRDERPVGGANARPGGGATSSRDERPVGGRDPERALPKPAMSYEELAAQEDLNVIEFDISQSPVMPHASMDATEPRLLDPPPGMGD